MLHIRARNSITDIRFYSLLNCVGTQIHLSAPSVFICTCVVRCFDPLMLGFSVVKSYFYFQ